MCAISSPYCGIFCSSMMSRGRASGTGTKAFTFPGCAVITMMRSPRNTASSTEWVMNTTVFLCSSQMWSSSSCNRSLFCASSAENGSSISRILGSLANARDRHALAHTSGKLVGIILGETGETGAREIVADHFLDGGGWRAPHLEAVGGVVPHRHPGEDGVALEDHRIHRAPRIRRRDLD